MLNLYLKILTWLIASLLHVCVGQSEDVLALQGQAAACLSPEAIKSHRTVLSACSEHHLIADRTEGVI